MFVKKRTGREVICAPSKYRYQLRDGCQSKWSLVSQEGSSSLLHLLFVWKRERESGNERERHLQGPWKRGKEASRSKAWHKRTQDLVKYDRYDVATQTQKEAKDSTTKRSERSLEKSKSSVKSNKTLRQKRHDRETDTTRERGGRETKKWEEGKNIKDAREKLEFKMRIERTQKRESQETVVSVSKSCTRFYSLISIPWVLILPQTPKTRHVQREVREQVSDFIKYSCNRNDLESLTIPVKQK